MLSPTTEEELSTAVAQASGPLRIQGGGTRGIGGPTPGEVCSVAGITGITLGTVEKLHAARRFYEKNGFFAVDPDALPQGFPRMPVDTHFYRLELG